MANDPFRHHPNLRPLIKNPEESYFRNFQPADMDEMMAERGIGQDWRLTDEDREAARQIEMTGRWDDDLWVFAYGSLCWDPAILFDEVRRAHVPSHARRFILKDTFGARGTVDSPGLMAALDVGPGCDGLAFRISRDRLEDETYRLWSRERAMPAYKSEFLKADSHHGAIEVLAFVADCDAPVIAPDLTRDEQVNYLANGTGFLGSSMEYGRNLQAGLKAINISDPDLENLLAQAEAVTKS